MPTTEERVDAVLHEFDLWFQGLGNDPLIGPERAIVKTFCYFLVNRKNTTALPVVEESDHGAQASHSGSVLEV